MNQTATSLQYKGLTDAQVVQSRAAHGANLLTPPAREPWWKLFLEKFDDPVIRILLVAAVISIIVGAVSGHYAEGLGIIVAVLLATVMAFANEYKANKEFDVLNKVNEDTEVKVVRNGLYTSIPRRDVVVGDVVIIEVGEEVPADGRLLEAVSLQVDESRLTGESVPAIKSVGDDGGRGSGGAETAYAADVLSKGTMVVDGHGVFEVLAVGDATEIGKTAREAAEETNEVTPLNRQLAKLSQLIGVVGFGIAALLFAALVVRSVATHELVLSAKQWFFAVIFGTSIMAALARVWIPVIYDGREIFAKNEDRPDWLEREDIVPWLQCFGIGVGILIFGMIGALATHQASSIADMMLPRSAIEVFLKFFMIAVTLIVVAVPEGLAMSVTLSLAYSVRKMTATNNLVRKMHACETIGAATIICTDKTGTLTQNEMRVHAAEIPGAGTTSALLPDRAPVSVDGLVAESVAANSTANLSEEGGVLRPLGNPTEGALLMWLANAGDGYLARRQAFQVAQQWTFSTERKYMATAGRSGVAQIDHVLHVKGAPEVILQRCTKILGANGLEDVEGHKPVLHAKLKEYQLRGMRTLGLACKPVDVGSLSADLDVAARDLVWLGFMAIADPVRQEVPGAIAACRRAGVEVKIITGDNRETATEIARQIGLLEAHESDNQHKTGEDFGSMNELDAAANAGSLRILSRARPAHKLRMVRCLQESGHVVAVTGDGTNDAPALNYANVGLAMGRSGTALAKEASDIILLDDSFQSIVNAILWGRSLYQNIQRFILFQLTINVAALGLALLGPFIGVNLPFTVTQMLWVNLIMDTFAALALAAEPPHADVMNHPPRKADASILTGTMSRFIALVGGFFMVAMIAFLLYAKSHFRHPTIAGEISDRGLTLFFNAFVLMQFWNLFNARCLGLKQSAFSGVSSNKGFLAIGLTIVAGQFLIVQFGGAFFRTEPLSAKDWLVTLGVTSLVLWIGEFARWVGRARSASRA